MKLKNNLTREAIENMYREQGYDEDQIEALMFSIENNLGLEKYVTQDINEDYMNVLIDFLEDGRSIDDYFLDDGTLDVPTLILDNDIRIRHKLGYY